MSKDSGKDSGKSGGSIPDRPDPTPTLGETAASFPFVNDAQSQGSKDWDSKYGDNKK
jgi:hypothetical protein